MSVPAAANMDAALVAQYVAAERTHWWFRARRALLVALLQRLLPRGGRLLDVGCGTGDFLAALPPAIEGWGLEPTPAFRAACAARGLTRVREADVTALAAHAGAPFDAITFLDVLEHLDDDQPPLRAARGLLAPGGCVVVTVPAYPWLWSRHDDLNGHRRRYTRATLAAALTAAGFAVERVAYFNALLFPLAVASRLLARLLGRPLADEMQVPPAPLNGLLHAVFALERGLVAGARGAGPFPVGLSVLAVGRVPGRSP